MKNARNCRSWMGIFLASTATLLSFRIRATELPASTNSIALRYEFPAGGGSPLWNFSGVYPLPFLANTNNIVMLHHAANGKVDGSETIVSDILPNVVQGGSVSGSVRNAGSNIVVRLLCKAYLSLSDGGGGLYDWMRVVRQDRLLLSLDTNAWVLGGTDRGTATTEHVTFSYSGNSFWPSEHVTRLGTGYFTLPVNLELPPTTDGSWSLDLSIVPNGNKLSGTASITCTNGKIFGFGLIGSYSEKTGKTKLLLRGTDDDRGAHLVLSLAAPEMTINSMRGTVGGQRVRFP